jgi:hypothetical protein
MVVYRLILLLFLLVLISPCYSQQTTLPADTVNKTTDNTFKRVEIEPEFPGGYNGWKKFVEQNLDINVPSKKGAPAGLYTVSVEFTVDRDGNVSDIKALTKLGYGMEDELIRMIRKSGTWTPAMQGGTKVKSRKKQGIKFIVMADDYDIASEEQYVLFTGMDNAITVTTSKVKIELVQVSISQGTGIITAAGNGRFIVRPGKPGRIVISLYDTKAKKPVGSVSFEVRYPDK